MENQEQQAVNSNNEIPVYRRPADRRTEHAGFRIYRDQADYLKKNHKGDSSKLIRFLLDSFINKRMESTHHEFERLKDTL
jgi:hypothetical protein